MPSSSRTSRRLLLILHGGRLADHGRAVRAALQRLRSEHKELHITVRTTYESGDVAAFVHDALMSEPLQYDTLIAGGGDGLLNELLAALLEEDASSSVSVGQIPLGTSNDLASAAGISLAPYDALSLCLAPDTARRVDVALVNGEVFANLATVGPISGVSSKEMSPGLKRLLGPAAVAVAGLRHLLVEGLPPVPGVVLTFPTAPDVPLSGPHAPDQVTQLRGDLLVLAAGQARQMGRMINLAPDALLDDGLLDFTLLFGGGVAQQAVALASDVVRQGLTAATGGLRLLRVPWLVVEAPPGQQLLCLRDGEPMAGGSGNRLVFEVLPRRVRMHLPDARLLVEGAAAAEAATAGGKHDEGGAAAGHHSGRRGLRWLRRGAARATGQVMRPRLLLDLWRAQQPPGRLSRLIPRLRKLLASSLTGGALLALGFLAGRHLHARQQHVLVVAPAMAGVVPNGDVA